MKYLASFFIALLPLGVVAPVHASGVGNAIQAEVVCHHRLKTAVYKESSYQDGAWVVYLRKQVPYQPYCG